MSRFWWTRWPHLKFVWIGMQLRDWNDARSRVHPHLFVASAAARAGGDAIVDGSNIVIWAHWWLAAGVESIMVFLFFVKDLLLLDRVGLGVEKAGFQFRVFKRSNWSVTIIWWQLMWWHHCRVFEALGVLWTSARALRSWTFIFGLHVVNFQVLLLFLV